MIHCRPGQYKTKEDIGVSFIAEAIEIIIIILEESKTKAPAGSAVPYSSWKNYGLSE